MDYLKRQPTFQMTRKPRHHITKPIRANDPNKRFAIDLIDVGEDYIDAGFKYILTCVDYFSRYVWGEALRNKTAIAVRDAKEIINSSCR